MVVCAIGDALKVEILAPKEGRSGRFESKSGLDSIESVI